MFRSAIQSHRPTGIKVTIIWFLHLSLPMSAKVTSPTRKAREGRGEGGGRLKAEEEEGSDKKERRKERGISCPGCILTGHGSELLASHLLARPFGHFPWGLRSLTGGQLAPIL